MKCNKRLQLMRTHPCFGKKSVDTSNREAGSRDVSLYQFFSKYDVKGARLTERKAPVALQVTPGFSADCSCVTHGMHEAYARRCVVAFWRLMPTIERMKLARGPLGPAYDGRLLGSTRLQAPYIHGGPPELDRFLGIGDLYNAFDGRCRLELVWRKDAQHLQHEFHARTRRFVRHDKVKRKYGWGFASVEMLVDPVLSSGVPQWMTEQFERRNSGFREVIANILREDRDERLTNTALIIAIRKELRQRVRRAAKDQRCVLPRR